MKGNNESLEHDRMMKLASIGRFRSKVPGEKCKRQLTWTVHMYTYLHTTRQTYCTNASNNYDFWLQESRIDIHGVPWSNCWYWFSELLVIRCPGYFDKLLFPERCNSYWKLNICSFPCNPISCSIPRLVVILNHIRELIAKSRDICINSFAT